MVIDQNIATLKRLNVETLLELQSVLLQVNQHAYTCFNAKGNASVGQHVRHTLEFYQCLFTGEPEVNYDARKRDLVIESSADQAIAAIKEILEKLDTFELDKPILLVAETPMVSKLPLKMKSSFTRELFYVLEHAIHHMALMRILIKDENVAFELSDSFGVAYSTLAFRSNEANG